MGGCLCSNNHALGSAFEIRENKRNFVRVRNCNDDDDDAHCSAKQQGRKVVVTFFRSERVIQYEIHACESIEKLTIANFSSYKFLDEYDFFAMKRVILKCFHIFPHERECFEYF